jgi:hypothetical protein
MDYQYLPCNSFKSKNDNALLNITNDVLMVLMVHFKEKLSLHIMYDVRNVGLSKRYEGNPLTCNLARKFIVEHLQIYNTIE